MDKLPTPEQNPQSLHAKYQIEKYAGTWPDGQFKGQPIYEPVDPKSEYFILRLDTNGDDIDHVKACRKAIHVYADEIAHVLPQLANDLRDRYPLL